MFKFKSLWSLLAILMMAAWADAATRWAAPGDLGTADCSSSGNACDLQQALTGAACGDTVQAVNGTYTGNYTISGTNCTSGTKLVVTAQNQHQATIDGNSTDVDTNRAFMVQRQHVTIQNFIMKEHGMAIQVQAGDAIIQDNLIHTMSRHGIFVQSSSSNHILRRNVIAFGGFGSGNTWAGISLANNTANTLIEDNVIYSITNNRHITSGVNGRIMETQCNNDDNIFRGNIMMDGAMSTGIRLFSCQQAGTTNPSLMAERNIIEDNITAHGQAGGIGLGENATSNIVRNNFFANIMYVGPTGKGDVIGLNEFRHNTVVMGEWTVYGMQLDEVSGVHATDSLVKDNLFYSPISSPSSRLLNIFNESISVDIADHNLFWSPAATGTWTGGYTFDVTDIHAAGSRPLFTNEGAGDFRLASGSPGKGAASEGGGSATPDIGINANTHLTASRLGVVMSLPTTTQNTGGGTSLAFSGTSSAHRYQVLVYVPETNPNTGSDTFTVEGQNGGSTSIGSAISGNWVNTAPRRWMYVGTYTNDGTVNISWTNANSASKILIRRMPTVQEAYAWITAVGDTLAPKPPTGLSATTISSSRIDVGWTPPTQNTDNSALTDLAGYKIYRCQNAGCTPTFLVDVGVGASYQSLGLLPSTLYRYQVAARDTSGNTSTLSTPIVEATTQAPPAPQLVAHWAFESLAGNIALDETANNHDGTVAGSPTLAAGQVGQALVLDGVNDSIRISRTTTLEPTAITICAWVKRNGDQIRFARILDKTWQNEIAPTFTSYDLILNRTGTNSSLLTFEHGVAGGIEWLDSSATAVPDGVWTHVCGRLNPSGTAPQKQIFINGNPDTSATATNAIVYQLTSTGDLWLGTINTKWFKGSLDEVRIYSGAIPDQDIAALAVGPTGPTPALAQTHWRWRRIDEPENGQFLTPQVTQGTIVKNNQARLRTVVSNTGDTTPLQGYALYCRSPAASGTWFALNNDCINNPVCYGSDQRLASDLNTTAQLTVAGVTFASGGRFYELLGNPANFVVLGANQYIEREHAIRLRSDVALAATIGCCERLSDGTLLATCSEATARVVAPRAFVP